MQKSARRVDFHIKINKEIRELFKKTCEEKGFSTCFIAETLFQGWVAAAPRNEISHPSSTITIRQKIEYMVERPRRRMVGVLKKHLENCYLNGCWTYRKPEAGEVLSKLHHVPECVCAQCKPFVSHTSNFRDRPVNARDIVEILPTE